MNRLRICLTLLLAGLPPIANSECRAAATVTYTLTDLGPGTDSTQNFSDMKFSDSNYVAPQIDNTGTVTYGHGPTEAGVYHFSTQYVIPTGSISGYEQAFYRVEDGPPHGIIENYGLGFGNGSYNSYAEAINSHGVAVGWLGPGKSGAFVYSPVPVVSLGGQPSYLPDSGLKAVMGPFGKVADNALGINDSGHIVGSTSQVVGSGSDYKIFQRAYITSGPLSEDLNTLITPGSGWLLTSATSINDLGQIVGYGTNPAGETRVYLLTPTATPEPAPWMLAVAAFGYLGLARLRSHWRAEK